MDTTERLHFHFSLPCIGEGNGNPLQCSCLENPRDGGAWWVAIYGVAQSRTQLKQLSSIHSLEGFPGSSDGKESACNKGDTGLIPGSGRSPGGGHGSPLQYSCRENPLDRGAWRGGGLYSPWGHKATEVTKHTTHRGREGDRWMIDYG